MVSKFSLSNTHGGLVLPAVGNSGADVNGRMEDDEEDDEEVEESSEEDEDDKHLLDVLRHRNGGELSVSP